MGVFLPWWWHQCLWQGEMSVEARVPESWQSAEKRHKCDQGDGEDDNGKIAGEPHDV